MAKTDGVRQGGKQGLELPQAAPIPAISVDPAKKMHHYDAQGIVDVARRLGMQDDTFARFQIMQSF
jgi:hypothetical protein